MGVLSGHPMGPPVHPLRPRWGHLSSFFPFPPCSRRYLLLLAYPFPRSNALTGESVLSGASPPLRGCCALPPFQCARGRNGAPARAASHNAVRLRAPKCYYHHDVSRNQPDRHRLGCGRVAAVAASDARIHALCWWRVNFLLLLHGRGLFSAQHSVWGCGAVRWPVRVDACTCTATPPPPSLISRAPHPRRLPQIDPTCNSQFATYRTRKGGI